jgi:predicted ATPase
LGYELKVSSFTDGTSAISDLFALRLVDKDTGVNVSIQDVGFGISQVLPIIVQSMLSRNSTLLIEQPEIHIHPRLQAELGSLLAECIKPPFENQFIIETHSEHLMLRLQKLIRKGKLKPEDISVIYVDRGTEGSKCLHLRLDEEGDFIDEWPDGFFEEDFNEIFQ